MSSKNPFDSRADRYDSWFESGEGMELFPLEADCLRKAMGEEKRKWLEVGVGTGRFAKALDIKHGIDPSEPMLAHAAARGISVKTGTGEKIPYPDSSFDGIIMVVTICFLDDPKKTILQCRRVLKPGGRLLIGLVPADNRWGEFYIEKSKHDHPFYSAAKFYTSRQIIDFCTESGFEFTGAHSCLFTAPEKPVTNTDVSDTLSADAGFVALGFQSV